MAKGPTEISAEDEIARRIAAARDKENLRNQDIADALGVTVDAVKKMVRGASTAQFAKLAELSRILRTTPNALLGFSAAGPPLGDFREALEASYMTLGLPPDQASQLAALILEVLEAPQPRSIQIDRRSSIRLLAEAASRRFSRLPPA